MSAKPYTFTPDNKVRTAAGVVIGWAYTRPPLAYDAGVNQERIQSALLLKVRDKPDPRRAAPGRPSLIPLDNSLLARLIRWARWAFFLKGPKL